MRTVLVPVEHHAFMRSVLDAALLVAGRFGSTIEALALGPDIPEVIGFDVPAGWSLLSEKEQRDLVERSRQLFEDFMRSVACPHKLRHQTISPTAGQAGSSLSTVTSAATGVCST